MYIAMNRFKVNSQAWQQFEQIWLTRESLLHRLPGFIEFHLLKGPTYKDYVLYASHTIWRSQSDFDAWTRSEEFRLTHVNAEQSRRDNIYIESPVFEGFEILQTITAAEPAVTV